MSWLTEPEPKRHPGATGDSVFGGETHDGFSQPSPFAPHSAPSGPPTPEVSVAGRLTKIGGIASYIGMGLLLLGIYLLVGGIRVIGWLTGETSLLSPGAIGLPVLGLVLTLGGTISLMVALFVTSNRKTPALLLGGVLVLTLVGIPASLGLGKAALTKTVTAETQQLTQAIQSGAANVVEGRVGRATRILDRLGVSVPELDELSNLPPEVGG